MKVLLPMSWLYRAMIALRNILYDRKILPIRSLPGTVISIGNIAVGGTGKSPLVQDLVARLLAAGKKPVVLTRGYKSGLRADEYQILLAGEVKAGVDRAGVHADEAMMQSMAQPDVYVVVGAKRYEAARVFLNTLKGVQPTHWVLDDGFQHRELHRDLNVVVIDVRTPWGSCIPAGLFREPRSALRRADVVVLTKSEADADSRSVREMVHLINPNCRVYEAKFDQGSLELVCGSKSSAVAGPYIAVCGIAKPEDFLRGLARSSLNLGKVFQYADHQSFDPSDVRPFLGECQGIITTAKDWARDGKRFRELGVSIYVAPLKVIWAGEQPDYFQ